jgi:hypothetical protein
MMMVCFVQHHHQQPILIQSHQRNFVILNLIYLSSKPLFLLHSPHTLEIDLDFHLYRDDNNNVARDNRQQGDTDAFAGYSRERAHLHLPKISGTPPHSRPQSRRASHASLTTPSKQHQQLSHDPLQQHLLQSSSSYAPPTIAPSPSINHDGSVHDTTVISPSTSPLNFTVTLTPPSPAPSSATLVTSPSHGDDNASYISDAVMDQSFNSMLCSSPDSRSTMI